MTQKDLLYIKTIADEGSISQAAKKLFVSQPSLSQSVRRIEDSLGVPLFKRTPKGLSLTPEGSAYIRMASRILSIYDAFEEEIRNQHELKTGTVCVGATPHRGPLLLPEFLARFHLRYPHVTVDVMERPAMELEDLLLEGKIDLALMRIPKTVEQSKSLTYRGLLRDSFLILLKPDHPAAVHASAPSPDSGEYPVLDPKWLAGENFLLPAPGMRLRDTVTDILKKAGIGEPKSDYSSIYMETLAYLAAAGQGVAIIPTRYFKNVRPAPPLCYSIPEEYGAFWDVCLVALKDAGLSRAAAAFCEEFSRYLGVQPEKEELY